MVIKKIELKYLRSSFIVELVVSVVAGLSAFFWQPFLSSETSFVDLRFKARSAYYSLIHKDRIDPHIVVVNVPENVHIRYNNPELTPRDYLADLVTRINSKGPKVIGLDYIFDHPAPEDDSLIRAIKDAGNVIIGYQRLPTIKGVATGITDTLVAYSGAARSLGFTNAGSDRDNIKRYYDFTIDAEPSFAHEVLSAYYGLEPAKLIDTKILASREAGDFFKKRFSRKKAVYGSSADLNYYRDPIYDLFAIFDSDDIEFASKSWLEDKIVIIGDSGYNRDVHKTPFSPRDGGNDTYGVLIQALAVKNYLDSSFIHKTPLFFKILIFLLSIMAASYVAYTFKFLKIMILLASLICAYLCLAIILFSIFSLLIPVTLCTSTLFFAALITLLFRIAFSEKDNIEAETVLHKNIPGLVIKKFQEHSAQSIFTPQEKEVIIIICLPKNIPCISGSNTSGKIIEFLNFYYKTIKEVIYAGEGSFNLIPLNGLLAFWNAPISIDNSYEKAFSTAKEILGRVELINHKGKDIFENFTNICMDVVIHQGSVLAGYYGPDDNKTYSIMGNAVNNTLLLAQTFGSDEKNWIVATKAVKPHFPPNIKYIRLGKKKLYRIL